MTSVEHNNSMASGESRDSWKSKYGFIIACIGSAVGMGNIWLFPSRVANYGGAFLAAYLLFDVLIGFSGVVGEMAFGRKARSGPLGAFSKAGASIGYGKVGRMLGVIPMIGAFMMAIGYSVVVSWIFKYTFYAVTGRVLHLGDAAMEIAEENGDSAVAAGISGFASEFGHTASAFGNSYWLVIAIAVTLVIMVLGIASGVEKANKLMIPVFYALFISLVFYVAAQPGSAAGYRHMFTIDPEKIRDPMMWVYALGQSFFSLSLAGNGTIIYGSYLSDDVDVVASAWKVALFDTLAAMLAALVIVPAMAAAGETAFSGGPGLMFIYLPHLFASMPGGPIVVIVFFVAVLLAGMSSLVNLFEVPIAAVQDHLGRSRVLSVALVGVIGAIISICIQGIVSDWMDFVSIYICPLGAGLAGVMFAWVWGKDAVVDAVSLGREHRVGSWFYPLYKYLFCILSLAVFLLGAVNGGIG